MHTDTQSSTDTNAETATDTGTTMNIDAATNNVINILVQIRMKYFY